MILGDEESKICRLTARREKWLKHREAHLKRVLRSNEVMLFCFKTISISSPSSSISPAITASPFMRSKVTICYRTLPLIEKYSVFRLGSRLGKTEECLQNVAELVAWFEDMADLA
ncbi:hypothetical protein DL96DRAFT_108499 [Flagelloscypha sp. PMI_526]|nr:hypothetical protein DL96DRAFT_108499 [Flagelloscypha sp. PMI_526]